MPHIDARTGEAVIRIVYDGEPVAGKTTNIEHLSNLIPLQRRGALKSPGGIGPRTEFFDWLDFSGGYLDGHRVRCQLISVPGQSHLLHRRKYLLQTADAIVFVADSRPGHFAAASRSMATTSRILEDLAREMPVGIIVQANKQDLSDAASPDEVARALGVDKTTPVLGSVASRGEGVMETFVLAARLATDRVRALLMRDTLKDLPGILESPEALHAAMLEVDMAVKAQSQFQSVEEQNGNLTVHAESATAPQTVEANGRKNGIMSLEGISIPDAQDIGSGHIWPPVKGRSALAAATNSQLTVPGHVLPWAPVGAWEFISESGWVLHSTDRWVFPTEAEARLRLLTMVRNMLPHLETLPDTRSLLLAEDGEAWRLWLLTPHTLTLREIALSALQVGSPAALSNVLQQALSLTEKLLTAGICDGLISAGAGGAAIEDGRLVLFALKEPGNVARLESRQPLLELSELLAQESQSDEILEKWFETQGKQLLRRRPSILVQ